MLWCLDSQLEDEEERQVAVVLAGTGVDPALERVVPYLGEYELPVSRSRSRSSPSPLVSSCLSARSLRSRSRRPWGPRKSRRLRISFGPEAFSEFFEALSVQDVAQALGSMLDREYQGGELAGMVKSVEDFFSELPPGGALTPLHDFTMASGHSFRLPSTIAIQTGEALRRWPA